jgi:hypothetical protein
MKNGTGPPTGTLPMLKGSKVIANQPPELSRRALSLALRRLAFESWLRTRFTVPPAG